MANYVRNLVSGSKARFKDEELDLDLDLVYVTDQLIVMGFPAEGLEGFYRNKRGHAKRFLDHRHRDKYWIFNFCPLTENSYDAAIFYGRVSRYPFPDHHAPPLAILALASREMRTWLSGSDDRVAVLHCKAGKGRSGTLACAFLLSLDVSPEPPRLERSYTPKQWAKLRAEEWMDVVETFDMPKNESPPDHEANDTSPTPNAPIYFDSSPVSNVSDISSIVGPPASDTSLSDPTTSNSPLRAASTLEKVLALHTARRMKQLSSSSSGLSNSAPAPKKPKQGVSIPSQRRFLLYWSLLLSNTAPAYLWPLTPQPVSARPKVKLLQITVRLREGGPTKMTFFKVVNKVLEKTVTTKGPKHAYGEGMGNLWVSLARYDDQFVEELENWERWTRDEQGHLGKRHKADGTHEGRSVTQIFEDGRWDKSKMIRSFAKLGHVKRKIDVQDHDKKERIYTHVLTPLNERRWTMVQNSIREDPITATSYMPPAMESEIDDICVEDTAQVSTLDDSIILEAGREVRAKLYMGQVFMGWLWFVPAFYMPQPLPRADDVPQSTHIRLSRKDVDFPLGIGSWIVDIDIEIEWVPVGSEGEASFHSSPTSDP
ncbi:phosphatases II [Gautieria morchelliformis]|nr:phosphatases II [Gautieria morchelliformis]